VGVIPGRVRAGWEEVGSGPVEELRGEDVAERVGREVAEQPGAPVDVLEHALGVVGILDFR
jgi:hypothetical protein